MGATAGKAMGIAIEIHGNMVPVKSVALAWKLEKSALFYLEDPIAPDSVLSYGEMSEKTTFPMTTGECNLEIRVFRGLVELAKIQFIRPILVLRVDSRS